MVNIICKCDGAAPEGQIVMSGFQQLAKQGKTQCKTSRTVMRQIRK